MSLRAVILLVSAAVLLLLPACAGPDPVSGCEDGCDIGVMVYVGDAKIRNYRPRPMLVTPASDIPRARHPAVDIHCHWKIDLDPADLIAAMDERGVTRAINLSGGWGRDLEKQLVRFARYAPDRLLIFCTPDFSKIDDPDFGAALTRKLESARAAGATGVKIFKNLGLTIRDRSGALVPVDDPRLDPLWATAGRLNMPVLIHTGDPAAFFQPIDRHNERWMQLKRHPDWSFHGPRFPGRDEVLAQRNRMIARHPGTSFIGAHMGGNPEDLAALGRTLDALPNLHVDISGRVAELGRQPNTARRFFLRYADRVLFGTDRYPGRKVQPRYRIYFRFLETADEYFDYYDHAFPPAGEWRIYGIDLPDEVLRKVYRANADRLLGFDS